jgi:uncharacterized membrane protein
VTVVADGLTVEPVRGEGRRSFIGDRMGIAAAVAAAGIWAWVMTFLCHRRFGLFLSHAFDMGQLEQAVWKIRHGHGGFSTVTGVHILGDHARFIVFPLAFLWPSSPGFLLALQAVALGSGAIPVYLLARRLATPGIGLLLAGLYCAYPALQYVALYDFHPEVLATPLLLWAFWATDTRRWTVYWPCVGVALLCREDVAVAVVLLGVTLWLTGERRVGWITVAVGVAAVGVDLGVMKVMNDTTASNFGRYRWIGATPTEALANVFLHPARTFREPFPKAAIVMGAGYLGPLPFVVAAGWRRLVAPGVVLLLFLLSSLPTQRSIYFHYGFLVVPFLFPAAAHGMPRLLRWAPWWRRAAFGSLVCFAAAWVLVFSVFTDVMVAPAGVWAKPAQLQRQFLFTHPAGYVEEARHVVSLIPAGQSVTAPGVILPHLARRPVIFMTPNPFYEVWYGNALTSEQPLPDLPVLPKKPPRWVIVDDAHRGPEDDVHQQRLVTFLDERYDRVYSGQFLTVWRWE